MTPASARHAAWGAVAGLLAVATGAFGAHALEGRVAPDLLEVWETGARTHLVHALALLAAAWAGTVGEPRAARLAGRCFAGGIVVFAGSLYLLAVTGARWLGAVTPVGGVLLMAGWGALAAAFLRRPRAG